VNFPTVGRSVDLTTDRPAVRVAIGAATVVAIAAVAAHHRTDPVVAGLLSIVVLCYGVLSVVDAAEQRLPNRITLPLAGATAIAVLSGGFARADIGSALGALAMGLVFALVFLLLRFGMGDVKLALTVGTIAGWLGSDAVMTTAYVGACSGGAVALLLIIVHRRRDISFSFGPFLALGSVAGMLAAGL
jgi:leader peptidase (prepilin peptidase)/N-methyltransferase